MERAVLPGRSVAAHVAVSEGSISHPLLSPWVMLAVAVLVVNDHVLKAAYPGWLTGKLSDIAGLLFFPLLLATAWQWLRPHASLSRATALAAVVTGICFASIQLSAPAGDAYRVGLGAIQLPFLAAWAWLQGLATPALARVALTPDVSDLLTLPILVMPVYLASLHRE